jgi:transcriptional regulator with XRE-family HTH domain
MVGQRISALLATLGISQAEFGRRIGREKFTVNDWIKGRGRPNIEDLAAIRRVFAVDLVDEDQQPHELTATEKIAVECSEIADRARHLSKDARRRVREFVRLLEMTEAGQRDEAQATADGSGSRTRGRGSGRGVRKTDAEPAPVCGEDDRT